MNWLAIIACATLGMATTLALIPFIRRRTERLTAAMTGLPFHHTHKTPVSRLGGVALAAAFVIASVVIFFWFPADGERARVRLVIFFSSLAMFGLGLWDDLRPLGARRKLIGQILIALSVCCFGVEIDKFKNPLTGEIYALGWWGFGLTVLWLVALTNMINLIDGIDGLAGGVGLMMMGLLVYVGGGGGLFYPILVAAGMFGALLGFLRYNFPPAKIYMGDGGAYFLGYLIAILTLVNSHKGTIVAALIAPLFALALPIVDVVVAIVRRGLKGLPIFRPDKKHLHHRMQEIGLSRTQAVLVMYGFSLVCLVMAFVVFWSQGRWVPILFGFMCLTLILSARSFNFSREWFAVGRVLENSLELRKETYYALALTQWLELEAERSTTLEALWEDFVFAARKLGFSLVELRVENDVRTWQSPEHPDSTRAWRCAHDLNLNGGMTITFGVDRDAMSQKLFEHLNELAAECWLKAATRWQKVSKLPLRFGPALVQINGFETPMKPVPKSA